MHHGLVAEVMYGRSLVGKDGLRGGNVMYVDTCQRAYIRRVGI